MDYFQILCAIGAVLLAIYYYYTSTYDHWKNRGIPGPKPRVFVGNFYDILTGRMSIGDKMKQLYNEYKDEPVFGIFEGRSPGLVINDLNLIQDVLVRDFATFVDRGFPIFPKAEPLGEHLFALEPERWRPLRAKLSPIFTSGKLKDIFPLIVECAGNLERYLDRMAKGNDPVECRDMAAKFTTDVIGSCAFGISMEALSNEESEFRKMGRLVFAPCLRLTIKEICKQFTPFLYNQIGRVLQPKGVDQFLEDVVRDTMKYREENNITRPDFINTLIELKNNPDKLENVELTNSLLAAQAFVFFAAGFETSSTTMAHALYELAQHQDVQDKLRQEIRETYQSNDGRLTYQALKDMKYLNKVFKETLRKYPVIPVLTRVASEKYTFKGTKITVEKGLKIWIPIYGIQKDPNIYPDPDNFDPERFDDVAEATRHPMTFLSFGNGPRNCIGGRFAHYQSKIGIITIIRNYKVDLCEETLIPYKSEPRLFVLTPKDGIYLKITNCQT
ncbi:putative cytochrome P450 6a14 [Xylocopa sonorina]|uniref:putative cytochrome P450 6a14 n=1 Tax=Xylocopa sonorina TaxID=1818115 RepID=UPI00403B2586